MRGKVFRVTGHAVAKDSGPCAVCTLVLPESTLEHPAGRHHTDLGAPNLAVYLQGSSSMVVTWLKLHLRRACGIPNVLPPLCADCAWLLS